MGGAFLLPSNQSQIYQSIVSPIIDIIRRKKLKEKAISSFNYTDCYCLALDKFSYLSRTMARGSNRAVAAACR